MTTAPDPGTGAPGSSPAPDVTALTQKYEAKLTEAQQKLNEQQELIAQLQKDKDTAEKARSGAMSARDKLNADYEKAVQDLKAAQDRAQSLESEQTRVKEQLEQVEKEQKETHLKLKTWQAGLAAGLGGWVEFLPPSDDEETLKSAIERINALREQEQRDAAARAANLEPKKPEKTGGEMTLKSLREKLANCKDPKEADALRQQIIQLARGGGS